MNDRCLREESASSMIRCLKTMQRELTPYEHVILTVLCLGKSNSAIATQAGCSLKIVENTVSRSARAFGIKSDVDINVRVLLALAYRSHFGDSASTPSHRELQLLGHASTIYNH